MPFQSFPKSEVVPTMKSPSNPLERHQNSVDELVRRLSKKAHGEIVANLTYGHNGTKANPIGELDVVHTEWRNGRQYITYYEVKTGENYRAAIDKAEQQAKNFFRYYPAQQGAKKTAVLVHPGYGVTRLTDR